MALTDIVIDLTSGVDPVITVDRAETVPLDIVVDTNAVLAIPSAPSGGGVEQVSFYTLG